MKPYYQSSTVTAYNCRFQEVIKDLPSDLLVVSDPPYNIGFKYDLYKDTMPDDEYIEMLAEFQKFGRVVLCHYPVETMRWIVPALGVPNHVSAWCYNSNAPGRLRLISWYGCEPEYSRIKQPYKNLDDRRIKEAIANGEVSTDEATKKPAEGEAYEEKTENKNKIPANCAQIASMDSYPDNLKLSPRMNLGMVSSNAAVSKATVVAQNGLEVAEIVCNLQSVCLNVVEKVLDKYPNAFVTSGFRKGTSKSQHNKGEAVDIQIRGISKAQYYEVAKDLASSLPVYDQLLLEYAVTANAPWIHISCTRDSNRRQIMTFHNHKKYKDGLIDLS